MRLTKNYNSKNHLIVIARLDRGVRRALYNIQVLYRNRLYAGLTFGEGILSPYLSHGSTMRFRLSGSEVIEHAAGGQYSSSLSWEPGQARKGAALP